MSACVLACVHKLIIIANQHRRGCGALPPSGSDELDCTILLGTSLLLHVVFDTGSNEDNIFSFRDGFGSVLMLLMLVLN